MTDAALYDPACASVVAALEGDPFYRCVSEEVPGDIATRRAALSQYFAYSMQEGFKFGRCVHLSDRARGASVWLLPQPPDLQAQVDQEKRDFLKGCLGETGCSRYDQIVGFMGMRARSLVRTEAWYLSIVAVDPTAQGKGLGKELLVPTLEEADKEGAYCYLETFGDRSIRFYERLGFIILAKFKEPTTAAKYTIMSRRPLAG